MNEIKVIYKTDGTDCYWVLLNGRVMSVMLTYDRALKEANFIHGQLKEESYIVDGVH